MNVRCLMRPQLLSWAEVVLRYRHYELRIATMLVSVLFAARAGDANLPDVAGDEHEPSTLMIQSVNRIRNHLKNVNTKRTFTVQRIILLLNDHIY